MLSSHGQYGKSAASKVLHGLTEGHSCSPSTRLRAFKVVVHAVVWQLQSKLVQTVQQHCLVWIFLDTWDMWLYSVFSWMFTIACCLWLGWGLGLGLDLVSGCAHVFVLLSIVIVRLFVHTCMHRVINKNTFCAVSCPPSLLKRTEARKIQTSLWIFVKIAFICEQWTD